MDTLCIKYFAATLFVFNQIYVINTNTKLFTIIDTVIVYILSRTIQLLYTRLCTMFNKS